MAVYDVFKTYVSLFFYCFLVGGVLCDDVF